MRFRVLKNELLTVLSVGATPMYYTLEPCGIDTLMRGSQNHPRPREPIEELGSVVQTVIGVS
jgi:hypothetical protein